MVTYRIAEEKDFIRINDFHNRIYSSNRTMEQFYWEFLDCPHGKSIYIIGEDDEKIVGTNCVIPISLTDSNNKTILTGKSEDTLVDPEYRGQNIFYNLYQVLFDKCIESNIKVIWGFTSAIKPFKKLGFQVPFSHQQSLAVKSIHKSYKYLSGLNQRNTLIDNLKILSLCAVSKLRISFYRKTDEVKNFHVSRHEITSDIEKLIIENLKIRKGAYAIKQSVEYMKWRVYKNPNYYKVHTFGFYDSNKNLKAIIVANSNPRKVAYVIFSVFNPSMSQKEIVSMISYMTKELFKEGVDLIRNWHFNHNSLNINETKSYRKAGYNHLNRGVGFVWKELGDYQIDPVGFYLSRIATQGVL